MEPFITLTAIAAPLPIDNIETDVLIPARMCVRPAGAGYGDALLAPWRHLADGSEDPDFVLNQPPYRGAAILVAGANFGFGSSREHAVWALRDFGVRAVIAPSFAAIFAANCVHSGILAATVRSGDFAAIVSAISERPTELTVELKPQRVVSASGGWPFAVPPLDKRLLLEGLDATALVLRHTAALEAFQRADRGRRPWIYEPLTG